MAKLDPWKTIDIFLASRGIKVGQPQENQTVGGDHAATSLHYLGRARDYSPHPDHPSDMNAVAAALTALALMPFTPIHELFYTPKDLFIKDGKKIIPSAALRDQHRDHLHVSLVAGADLRKYAAVAAGAGVGLVVLIFVLILISRRI